MITLTIGHLQKALALASIPLLFISCDHDAAGPVDDPAPIVLNTTQKKVVQASNAFGLHALKALDKDIPDSNYCFSPLSISAALGMTWNGAEGATQQAMQQVLGFDGMTEQQVNEAYKALFAYLLSADPSVILEIANSIWHEQAFTVLSSFIQVNQDYFNADVFPADFSNPATLQAINQWVNDRTHGRITSILEIIPPDVVMYLINAVYFKGDWKYRFDMSKTHLAGFFSPGGMNNVATMEMRSKIMVAGNGTCDAVRLPYGNDRFSMVAMLPAEGSTMDDVLGALTPDAWKDLMGSFAIREDFLLYLPKFRFAWDRKLNELLAGLGMGIAFTPGMADFSGINPNVDLFISEVKHKTYIDVNENGTEAAAVTSVAVGYGAVDMLAFNRPFLFFIVEEHTGFILFAGKVNLPEYDG